jgi:hypothetical protein
MYQKLDFHNGMKTTITLPHAMVAFLPFPVACNAPGYAYHRLILIMHVG